MKKLFIITFLLLPMLGTSAEKLPDYLKGDAYEEPEFAPGAKAPKFYEESMKTHDERIQWWVDGRFGCFMHWGVYSQLGGVWNGEAVSGYSEHIQRKCKISHADYAAEAAAKFNPVGFDAEEWVKLIKAAGMRYLVITAKHHDGFAMYDSDVSDWNIMKATPFGRDPMAELKAACVKHGIKFGFYYSHAFDWGDPNGPGNDWEWKNPGGDDLLGGKNWWDDPVMGRELPRIRENYVNKKAIPQVVELLKKYDPDIMWFDTPHKLPNSENWRIFKALRDTDSDVVVNGRFIYGFGDYKTTCDKPAQIKPTSEKYWEAIPTTNESYGYHSMDKSHKPAAELIQLLIKAVARGGNILMNIGPRGDGRIDDPDVNILKGFAKWMAVAGDSIHGCGKSGLPVQAWGESTAKDGTIYLQVFQWPLDGKLRVGGLASDPASARILGAEAAKITFQRLDKNTLELSVPAKPVSEVSTVVALTFKGDIETGKLRLLDPGFVNELNVFDGKIEGRKLKYGSGARGWKVDNHKDCLVNWVDSKDSVSWELYVRKASEYEITACYHGLEAGAHIEVQFGKDSVSGKTEAGSDVKQVLGTLKIPAGECKLVWRMIDADKKDRIHPQALMLKQVK